MNAKLDIYTKFLNRPPGPTGPLRFFVYNNLILPTEPAKMNGMPLGFG